MTIRRSDVGGGIIGNGRHDDGACVVADEERAKEAIICVSFLLEKSCLAGPLSLSMRTVLLPADDLALGV